MNYKVLLILMLFAFFLFNCQIKQDEIPTKSIPNNLDSKLQNTDDYYSENNSDNNSDNSENNNTKYPDFTISDIVINKDNAPIQGIIYADIKIKNIGDNYDASELSLIVNLININADENNKITISERKINEQFDKNEEITISNFGVLETIEEGFYKIEAILNNDKNIQESNFDNNSFTTTSIVNIIAKETGKADFVPVEIRCDDGGNSGLPLNLSIDIKNQGTDSYRAPLLFLFMDHIDENGAFDTYEELGYLSSTEPIASNQTITYEGTLIIPKTIELKTYTIYLIVNPSWYRPIDESDLANNTMSKDFIITGIGNIDLEVEYIKINDVNINIYKKTNIEFRCKNNGENEVAPSYLSIFLNKEKRIDSGVYTNLANNNIYIPNLKPGEIYENKVDLEMIPTNEYLKEGDYYMIAYIDVTNLISESDENNNYAISDNMFPLILNIDLEAVTVNANPLSLNKGDTIKFDFQINNNLDGYIRNAEINLLRLYLSTDDIADASDFILVNAIMIYAIKSNQEIIYNFEYKIPSTIASGDYYYFIVADPEHVISEKNETNNIIFSKNKIHIN